MAALPLRHKNDLFRIDKKGGSGVLLDFRLEFAMICQPLHSGAYPEWLRGQALGSHSNLAQMPRC